MKDQYFGDVNDYLKYGILRELKKNVGALHVVWMLTPSDGSTDGKFTDYLAKPEAWRQYDPSLFDFLKSEVIVQSRRAVEYIEPWEGLPGIFSSKIVPDDRPGRQRWSAEMLEAIPHQSLVFFDPDNGIEVPSCPMGRKRSSKYVYWNELAAAWHRGASLLVYQHFTRENRERFLERLSLDFKQRLGAQQVTVLRTPRVAFFLVPQGEWAGQAEPNAAAIQRRWNGRIRVEEMTGIAPEVESAST